MFELIEVKYKDIVDIPHLRIRPGLTALIGPSGSGKTTVLRMLNKMISPTQGQILYHGSDLHMLRSVEHRRSVMMLSQNPVMFEGSIRDNLTVALHFQERPSPADTELCRILASLQLDKELDSPAHQLSGGEKQRLALARLFLCDPAVFLLDEPSSALDEDTEDTIIRLVSEHLRTNDRSAIMVTHSKSIAEKYADEIVEMAAGVIINRRTA